MLSDDPALARSEVVISAKTGRAKQAGADLDEGHQILRWRALAEKDLYFFSKFIGGSHFLTPRCHGWMCRKIQHRGNPDLPETRKLILMPRKHAKSHIASQLLPPHVLIQPAETNVYFPGKVGADTRILLCVNGNVAIACGWLAVLGVVAQTQAEDGMELDHGLALHYKKLIRADEVREAAGKLVDQVHCAVRRKET